LEAGGVPRRGKVCHHTRREEFVETKAPKLCAYHREVP
jgi:hypothetical protein